MDNKNQLNSDSLLKFFMLSAEIRYMYEVGMISNVFWHKYIIACIRSCERSVIRKINMNQSTLDAINHSLEQIIMDNSYIKNISKIS